MAMQWKDHRSVGYLFERRRELTEWLALVDNGRGECSINGRYMREKLSDAHAARLDGLLRDHLTTEIALLDGELAKLGVVVTEIEPD